MSNKAINYRYISRNDSELSLKSHMNEWHLISAPVCAKIDVLLDLINVREGYIYIYIEAVMVLLEMKSTS